MIYRNGGSYELVGVVSFGYGCARPNTPGIYANMLGIGIFVKIIRMCFHLLWNETSFYSCRVLVEKYRRSRGCMPPLLLVPVDGGANGANRMVNDLLTPCFSFQVELSFSIYLFSFMLCT